MIMFVHSKHIVLDIIFDYTRRNKIYNKIYNTLMIKRKILNSGKNVANICCNV